MDPFVGLVVAVATVVGTIGGLILQYRGNQHFAEQNRIMIEQGGSAAPKAKIYRPPYWPLISMGAMVLLCWGAALYNHKENDWAARPLRRVEHQYFKNQSVELDGKEFIDTTFDNVSFVYHGTEPTRLNAIKIVNVKPGEQAGALISDNPTVITTLNIVSALDKVAGCQTHLNKAPD